MFTTNKVSQSMIDAVNSVIGNTTKNNNAKPTVAEKTAPAQQKPTKVLTEAEYAKKSPMIDEELQEAINQLSEKLSKSADAGAWIHDFDSPDLQQHAFDTAAVVRATASVCSNGDADDAAYRPLTIAQIITS